MFFSFVCQPTASPFLVTVVASDSWFAVSAILHWMCCPRTTEVTSGDVVSYTRDDGGVFDANAKTSVLCRDGGSFPSVSTCSEPTFSFVAVVRNAITASSLAGAVIICETVSGVFPRGPDKLVGELTGYMAEEPVVVYPVLFNQEFPLVVSTVTQPTGRWIVLTRGNGSTECDSLHHRRVPR